MKKISAKAGRTELGGERELAEAEQCEAKS
jgi:hypothetical protein